MRVGYVVVGENLVRSGILRGQVITMVKYLKALKGVDRVRVMWWGHPLMLFRERSLYRELKREFAQYGVSLMCYPLAGSFKWGYVMVGIVVLNVVPLLIWEVLTKRISILQCRSYLAGWGGLLVGKFLKVKVIFDPRGPYPEEMVVNHHWKENGLSYRLWKRIERLIVQLSDSTIGVTRDWVSYYRGIGSRSVFMVINRSDTQLASQIPLPESPQNEWRLVFIGEMDTQWYHPQYVIGDVVPLLKQYPQFLLVLVTRKPSSWIIDNSRVPEEFKEKISVISASPNEISTILSQGHFGLITGRFLGEVFPVKTGEYLAAGLPLVVSPQVGETLTSLVKKHKLGAVVDFQRGEGFELIEEMVKDYPLWSQRCRQYALKRLDISTTARHYYRIYRTLLSRSN
ncbi:MAG: glycosyltransferase [bacterium]